MKNVYGILEQYDFDNHPTIKRNIYNHKKDAIAACKKDGFVKAQSFMVLDTWVRETTVRTITMFDFIEEADEK